MPLDLNENSIEWLERQLTHDKKSTPIAMRASRAKIDKNLTSEMRDASREIDRAYEDLAKGFGYALLGIKVINVLHTKGGEPSQEFIDQIKKRLAKLHKWEFECRPHWRKAVYAINQTEHTATTYASLTGYSVKTIMEWYRSGLESYCILQGWIQK